MVQLPQLNQLSVHDTIKNSREYKRFTPSMAGTIERNMGSSLVGRLDVSLEDVGSITNVAFCPFVGSEHLLVTSADQQAKLFFFRVSTIGSKIEVERLQDLEIGDEITCISWSPETQCLGSQANIKLAISLFNQKEVHVLHIRLRTRSLLSSSELAESGQQNEQPEAENTEFELLERRVCEQNLIDLPHHLAINEVSFEPQQGNYLAGVGQDKFCYIWDSQTLQQEAIFTLSTGGQSVSWCPTDPNRFVVAEKSGVIRMYDLAQKMPIMTFTALSNSPLTCMDWCRSNELIIAASIGSETVFWQISLSGLPAERIPSNHKGSEKIALYNQNLFAIRSKPRSQIVVFNRRLNQMLLEEQLNAGNGLSWHAKQPVLVAGAYGKIVLFQLNAYT